MLKDILDIIFSLPTKEQMENMTDEKRDELIKKFDEPSTPEEE